jgi:hypothetical protein
MKTPKDYQSKYRTRLHAKAGKNSDFGNTDNKKDDVLKIGTDNIGGTNIINIKQDTKQKEDIVPSFTEKATVLETFVIGSSLITNKSLDLDEQVDRDQDSDPDCDMEDSAKLGIKLWMGMK